MARVTERQLAWELTDRASALLSREEHTAMFVDLDSDEFLEAIHRILHIVVQRHTACPR